MHSEPPLRAPVQHQVRSYVSTLFAQQLNNMFPRLVFDVPILSEHHPPNNLEEFFQFLSERQAHKTAKEPKDQQRVNARIRIVQQEHEIALLERLKDQKAA